MAVMRQTGLRIVLDDWIADENRLSLARLRAARLGAWKEAKALAESAALENRVFTEDEQGQWDLVMAHMSHLDGLLRAWLA